MSNRQSFDKRCLYQVWVKGLLDERWSGFFDGLAITSLDDRETLLSGMMADQAALHGLLAKIRDLGLILLAVKRIDTEEEKVEAGRQ